MRQANSRYVEELEGRADPHNESYYRLTGRMELLDEGDDIDVKVLEKATLPLRLSSTI